MEDKLKEMSHKQFVKYVDKLSVKLRKFINEKGLKIDYIVPVLRSGAEPAVYIANRLNIVKFLPMQVKHITYKNNEKKIEMIFNSFDSVEIKKLEPIFLVVEAKQSTGTSAKICIDEIKNRYKNAKILYVCLAKKYDSMNFDDTTIYEDNAFFYNGGNKLSKRKCKQLNIEYYEPLFPWEILKMELTHPDDLEENIFF